MVVSPVKAAREHPVLQRLAVSLALMAVYVPAYAHQLLPLLRAWGLRDPGPTVLALTLAALPLLPLVSFARFAQRVSEGDSSARTPGHAMRALAVLPGPVLICAVLNVHLGVPAMATLVLGVVGEIAGWAYLTRVLRHARARRAMALEEAPQAGDSGWSGGLVRRTAVHTLPREARDRHGWRLASALVVFVIGSVAANVYIKPMVSGLGLHGVANIVVATYLSAVALFPWFFVFRSTYSVDFSSARLEAPFVLASWCALTVLWFAINVGDSALAALGVLTPLIVLGAAAICLGSTAAAWIAVYRHVRASSRIHRHRLVRVEHVRAARDLITACRRDLLDPSISGDERSAVELNLAGALVTLSRRGDGDDALPEAYALIDRALRSSRTVWTFLAAGQHVEAMHVKAERSGDLNGYDDALRLLLDAATNAKAELPDAPPKALAMRAQCLVQLSERAASAGDQTRSRRLHDDATSDLRRAVDLAPGRRLRAEYTIELARVAGPHPLHGNLDTSIADCRRALRTLWLSSWSVRAEGYLALADLLALRAAVLPHGGLQGRVRALGRVTAAVVPARATTDRLRALWLCVLLVVAMEAGGRARERIAGLWKLPRAGERSRGPSLASRRVAGFYRRTFEDQVRSAPSHATELAARWTLDAARRGDVREAAEAHWCWIRAVVADSRRRVVATDKRRRLQRVQGSVADACSWLVRAGRARDAAVALDLGRAVLLTERMQREVPDLADRLVGAGREDLSDRWLISSERIARADRSAFEEWSHGAVPATAGRTVTGGFASEEYLALVEHERLLQEIGRVPGCEDIDAALDFDDLRRAAATGPIVYLTATDSGGYAVIVTDAAEPEIVDLPTLTTAEVEPRAHQVLNPTDFYEAIDGLAELLPWLWEAAMSAVASAVEPRSLVTLIPVGSLGLLPLHAACEAPGDDDVWRNSTDGLVFRYAPNARVLLRAQQTASGLAGERLTAVTVAVPDPPGHGRLPCASIESDGVCEQLGAARVARPSPASVARVLTELDRATVWHFACHGEHDPGDPLDSRLLLEDGPLTLRALLARTAGRRRLAVLSACHTAAPDAALLDEVISFPSAMLGAGVAGVVASQIAVTDECAMLTVVCFFERLASGAAPPNALADAQAWLRTATNAQVHARFPRLYPLPGDHSEHDDAYWKRRHFSEPYAWAAFAYSGA